MLTFYS